MSFLPEDDLASLWNVVSARRVAAERVAAAQRPAVQFDTTAMCVEDAWLWLPTGCLDGPQAWADLALMRATVERDPRFPHRLKQGFCRLDCAVAPFKPGQPTLARVTVLLRGLFEQWSAFANRVQWAQTTVVLVVPDGVSADTWLDTVLMAWPDAIRAHSYRVMSDCIDTWYVQCLRKTSGAQSLLVLSVNSRIFLPDLCADDATQPAGECVSALYLRRIQTHGVEESACRLYPAHVVEHAPRALQPPKHTLEIEQVVQSLCEGANVTLEQVKGVVGDGLLTENRLAQMAAFREAGSAASADFYQDIGMSVLTGNVGHCAMIVAQLSLAYLLASEKAENGVLVLDRLRSGRTSGWLLTR